MLKTAFVCWEGRIAPVFDTAKEFLIVETQSGKVTGESREDIRSNQPLQKVLYLAELHVDVLVCGAITADIQALVEAYGIRVVPFITGNLDRVVEAWNAARLPDDAFVMPGCGFQRRGRGRGRGMGRGRRTGKGR